MLFQPQQDLKMPNLLISELDVLLLNNFIQLLPMGECDTPLVSLGTFFTCMGAHISRY